jgi:hypothetical protein
VSEINGFTGRRYCEMRPLTESRFAFVTVFLEDDGSEPLTASDVLEAADLAKLAVMSMNRDAGHPPIEDS